MTGMDETARQKPSDPSPGLESGKRLARAPEATAIEPLLATPQPPPRPASLDPKEIGFEPQQSVRWFQPFELLRAGVKAVLADLFGAYADRRELQAALHPLASLEPFDYSSQGEIWFDYVADVGDGFDATYAVASLLARERLELPGREPLPRGQVLILGGDEVYPTATRVDYQNRTVGPFRAALPWVTDETRAPHVFAIPGNHDWYDGLTAFLRQFTQRRWIGGWKTRQRRSYFVLQLPQRYWVWGIDIQLHADVDGAQLEYFRHHAAKLAPGDRVIICTSEPSWVKDVDDPEAVGFKNLLYLMREAEPRAEVVLLVTGDSHHYARYLQMRVIGADPIGGGTGERLFVTAGGGGAFLHGTHTLPKHLCLPGLDERAAPTELELCATYPGFGDSEAQVVGLRAFPVRHWGFAALWAALWALLGLALTSASASRRGAFHPGDTLYSRLNQTQFPIDISSGVAVPIHVAVIMVAVWFFARRLFRQPELQSQNSLKRLPVDVLPWLAAVVVLGYAAASGTNPPLITFVQAVLRSPASLLLLLVAVVGSGVYVSHKSGVVKYGIGACHAVVHVLAWLGLCVLLVSLTTYAFPGILRSQAGPYVPFVWLLLSSLLAGGVSAMIFALFLWFAARYLPGQLNDVFSAIGSPDFKNFLRLHIAADGSLTIHPVGLARVPREWRANPGGAVGDAFIVPASRERLQPTLIERPITLTARDQGQRWLHR